MIISSRKTAVALVIALASAGFSLAQILPMTPDIPAKFTAPETEYDYVKRVEMLPMRDGVKLYTVIVIPKGAVHAPILLTRTPYDAAHRTERTESPHMLDELSESDDVFVKAGYIRVFQDVRGKYGSQGAYVMTPPPSGPLNPSGPNDTADAWDTIDGWSSMCRSRTGKLAWSAHPTRGSPWSWRCLIRIRR
jgi:predicted acyl esterase